VPLVIRATQATQATLVPQVPLVIVVTLATLVPRVTQEPQVLIMVLWAAVITKIVTLVFLQSAWVNVTESIQLTRIVTIWGTLSL
jgi:hypothetical protein